MVIWFKLNVSLLRDLHEREMKMKIDVKSFFFPRSWWERERARKPAGGNREKNLALSAQPKPPKFTEQVKMNWKICPLYVIVIIIKSS